MSEEVRAKARALRAEARALWAQAQTRRKGSRAWARLQDQGWRAWVAASLLEQQAGDRPPPGP